MNDLTLVMETLKGAVSALESREAPLTPLEKMKLKSLRLNLEAARCAAPVVVEARAPTGQLQQGPLADPMEDRFRTLQAISNRLHAEARALIQEVRARVARAGTLTSELRTSLAYSERNCARLSDILRPN